jgi:hypothetical protein
MQRGTDEHHPASYDLAGGATWSWLGDLNRDEAVAGVKLDSVKGAGDAAGPSGSVSQTVNGIDVKAGKQFRFSFKGMPEEHFAVDENSLYMKVEFFGDGGKTGYDGKAKKLYSLIEQARKDMTVNGVRHVHGANIWRTYGLDFMVPFPQVDQIRVSVGFDHGAGTAAGQSSFCITEFKLERLPESAATVEPSGASKPEIDKSKLLPIGGRWFYNPAPGETAVPATFDYSNADRLLYHDSQFTAPFSGMMTSWLRAGEKDINGIIVTKDQYVPDSVTVTFDATSLIIHSKNLPNHPTGKFPEPFGGNPTYITEKRQTFYIPLDPKVNAKHIFTAKDNSNHALNMGPIGVAVNGVVFFNPFDANSQDATDLMDRCCGHPAPDGTYHYHKYPICVNSPWMDEGTDHSPLIGFAFDGFPVYGPYEKANVMAKDITGETALNEFNMHFDADRGWHYHVTPGKFPYIIGGYWGPVDARDVHRGPGGRGMRPPGGPGGPENP